VKTEIRKEKKEMPSIGRLAAGGAKIPKMATASK
jgi:hypothetical protein